ncbi:YqzK family protein [Peribacillus psychrosaccharolyticus]|jgi:hypothetical protein|uniref:YqzK family protein n=1 Tax=Peribacillus psychrosaccharolyticus TaxID=1407 RepID=A0A974S035_PERPY|nr:YqzK family protein [Peribacillus psychrosaccharolyticus]MEC2056793.1 YqzK family protein [Peribacillus psychrosaccharolyticus]MED3746247.1 YqzK family protein [Peribacillus psychrosaccharolyticus]QQT00084.1 YqzK family protein [Peribacillus psychrosaccharolyticus]
MKTSVNLFFQIMKVLLLFVCFTVLFYLGMVWLNQEYEGYQRYSEPKGAAIKVMKAGDSEEETWLSRLMLLYLDGE